MRLRYVEPSKVKALSAYDERGTGMSDEFEVYVTKYALTSGIMAAIKKVPDEPVASERLVILLTTLIEHVATLESQVAELRAMNGGGR